VLAIVLKIAMRIVPPETMAWFRFAIAFVVLAFYVLITKPSLFRIFTHPPWKIVLAGIFLGINYFGFIKGIHYTTPSVVQIFIQLGPIALAIIGIVFFKEKIVFRQWMGLIIVAVGMAIFYNQQLNSFTAGSIQFNQGIWLVLLGAAAWTAYAVIQKTMVQKYHPVALNLIAFMVPSILYLPVIDYQIFAKIDWITWLLVIFLGLNTVLAYGSLSVALKYAEANRVSMIIILNPVITFILLGLLHYYEIHWAPKENYTWLTIVGAMTALTGALLVVLKKNSGKPVSVQRT
jgi:drug/metabolite transporter (DMT)-like permease